MSEQAAIVERLVKGESAAFRELISLYGPRLLLKAKQMLGNDADAQDCVQDCYLQVLRNISSFRGEADLFSWMYKILVNSCLQKIRKKTTKNTVSIDSLLPEFDQNDCRIEPMWNSIPTTEEVFQQNHAREKILESIQSLPESYRDVLYLRDIEGYNTSEVSKALSLSEGAIKVRLHRGRSALKKILEPIFREIKI